MPKEIELKSGEKVIVRARCSNPKCELLLISNNSDLVTSDKERTIHPSKATNQSDLRNIPFVICVNCRE